MTIRNLAEVGARLEESVLSLPGEVSSPTDLYEQYEMIAIQILDSEFDNYAEGGLLRYLEGYLAEKRRILGISI